MKYVIYPAAFAIVALLSSCTGLGAFNPANWLDDPEVVKAGAQIISGEWYGAAYTVASWLLGKAGIAGYKKVKASPAGTIGIIRPTSGE